ncbi:Glutamine--fructose-6-phosphate aminotransferase [isomerizing] [Baekduia alba]|uniref:SIS domain-containing protein n=1 Tax=Baekduia alba TaxID=2997333 RepID=UPI00234022D2|nr:SIS domain-containing protein [Baekduia alba]WCB92008.1 Glutamine--fructose-6-phosphate aminotransferase [isomerizing] [Baekduia alba]
MTAAGAQMTAEMAEQPRVLAALAARRDELTAHVRDAVPAGPTGIVLVARGSSDNAAVFGRYVLELATRRPVALAAPSLVTRYGVQDRLDGWLAVGVSQSGRTPEIVSVLESFGAAGATTVAITNDRDSALARVAAATIDTAAGAEKAVPATKTVTAQFAAFALLAEALSGGSELPWSADAWAALPDAVEAILADDAPARAAAEVVGDAQGLVAIARGLLLGAALEAALKLKEMTGILAEGASAADFLHGPIAVVRRELPVLTLAAGGPAAADVAEFADAARARGGRVLTIAPDASADLPIPTSIPDGLAAITATVRAQQLAREVSLLRGIDPDSPFGLSKVTETH